MVSKLQDFRAPRFQSRNPLLEPLQEFLAGSLAGTFPDAITKLADLVWVLFYVVLLCFISLHFSLLNVRSCFMCQSWNHKTLKNLETCILGILMQAWNFTP
jgi:ABC-type bacteriocin/lantibiotic exporter with double-glycine peptidase domain